MILAFFGYNEAFAGEAGLPKFKENVADFIKHTLSQKYNGKIAPRLVLFSPIAHEDLHDPQSPRWQPATTPPCALYASDGRSRRRQQHSICRSLRASQRLYKQAKQPLTINGIHLNAEGDRQLARPIDAALFGGEPRTDADLRSLDALHKAVLAKDFYWFNRYRVVDGYSTYGDRAFLKFSEGPGGYGNGLSNYSVAQRELEMLDLLTSNRDKVIWAAAQGKTVKPDDSNLPDYIPVVSNLPGPLPGGKHVFLSGEDSLKKMTVADGMKVCSSRRRRLSRARQSRPDGVRHQGRLWVARLAYLPALEADRTDGRQTADS